MGYLTVKEVAGIVRRHQRTIYRWLDEGFLAGKKVRDGWLIPADEVDRILNNEPDMPQVRMTSCDTDT